ncbi:MAG: hypothetical protein FRX48_09106 [Lasallia pustulata]|uniref:Uncharacterized protein n=1 Tax=Lasallia pustulata TaxID=136370 RepID=A0A5M8PDR4_9LECA|nr:MAG: hypothetical protein FRX48_09106 [Lasallia pustulata]
MAANLEEQNRNLGMIPRPSYLPNPMPPPKKKYAVNPANPKERLRPVPYCNHCDKIGRFDKKRFILHLEMKKRPSEKAKANKDKERKEKGKKPAPKESDSPAGMMSFSGDEISESLDLSSFGFMAGHSGNGSLARLAVLDTWCSQHCSRIIYRSTAISWKANLWYR